MSAVLIFADITPQIHLVLVSRRKLTNSGVNENDPTSLSHRLEKLRSRVAKLSIESCDVSDWTAVQQLARKYEKINGIVHAAGLPGGGFVIKQTWEKVSRVLAPKINGTWNLLQMAKNSVFQKICLTELTMKPLRH